MPRPACGWNLALRVGLWAALCGALPLCAAAGPWEDVRRAGPFVCRADFPLSSQQQLFAHLEQLGKDLQATLATEPPKETVELYLFRTKASYRDYLQRHLPKVPERRALYVKGNGPGKVFVYKHAEMEIDVRHEGTHALLHAALPMVPLWLDEGLAEYFEVPPDERAHDHPHLDALAWNLRLGSIARLHRLEAKRDLSEMTATDYRHSWAWVHFMLHGPPPARDELTQFLADIAARIPPGELSRRLEARLPGVDRHLVQHFKTWRR